MKKLVSLSAALVLLAVWAGSAEASQGVVLVKDAKRKAVAVAAGRSVRTIRVPRAFGSLRVGQRIAYTARRAGNGTLSAPNARRLGRAKHVRFGATVVAHQRPSGRLIVSAGGSVFSVRIAGAKRTLAAGTENDSFSPGDKVDVDASVDGGGLEAKQKDVKETGRAKMLELEGIFLWTKSGGFELAVIKRGLVHVAVPAGSIVPDFEPGDQISLVVAVTGEGTFLWLKGRKWDDNAHGEKPKPTDPEKLEASGKLTERSAFAVTVSGEKGALTCSYRSGLDLSIFRLGEKMTMWCRPSGGKNVLVKLHGETGWVKEDGRGEMWAQGLLSLGDGTVAVKREDGSSASCAVPTGLDLSAFRAGEKSKLECVIKEGRFTLALLRNERAWIKGDGTSGYWAYGPLAERSATAVAVRREDGTLTTCGLPAGAPDLAAFRIGDKVSLECVRREGADTVRELKSDRAYLSGDGSLQLIAYGLVSERTESLLTVRREDETTLSCAVPAGVDLSAFPAGTKVKLYCRKKDGAAVLEKVASEHKTVEVPNK